MAGPEAANNAGAQTAFIPLLTLQKYARHQFAPAHVHHARVLLSACIALLKAEVERKLTSSNYFLGVPRFESSHPPW